MSDGYREPTEDEKVLGEGLVGSQIEIYWDGDFVFYPCKVTKYDATNSKYSVIYENDDTGVEYIEDLDSSQWRIWDGSEEDYAKCNTVQRSKIERSCKSDDIKYNDNAKVSIGVSAGKVSYSVMVVEAVMNLADRHGSSLPAIRKYITANYELKKQQTASFNALTLKAVNKAVAMDELERVKGHSFRISRRELDRRKEKEKQALRQLYATERMHFSSSKGSGSSRERGRPRDPSVYTDDEHSADRFFMPFYGTAAANNKSLRKELIAMRSRRDKFLMKRMSLIESFLPAKNYFTRKAAHEQGKREKDSEDALHNSEAGTGVSSAAASTAATGTGVAAAVVVEGTVAHVAGGGALADSNADTAAVGLDLQSPGDLTSSSHVKTEEVSRPQQEDEAGEDMAVQEKDEEEDFDEVKQQYCTMDGVKLIEKPPILTAELHEHQVEGISWMVHMFQQGVPMILGDQMGLGKTLQSIGFLAYLTHTLRKKGPHLIVVPLSVLSNWLTEIERFCPSFRAVRFHGPKEERNRIKAEELSDLNEFDILVTTYEILVSECNYFRRKYIWTTVIVDEGHRLKNEKSQLSDKLRQVPCLSKVILTGTPLQNNLRELWAMLYYLVPDIFMSSSALFEVGFDLGKGLINNAVLRKARKLLSVFMLRRLKENVSIKLPSRKEVTILVPLSPLQIDLYKQLLSDGLDGSMIETVMNCTENSDTNNKGSSVSLSARASEETASAEPHNGVSKSASMPELTADSQSTVAASSSSNDSEYRKLMNLLLQLRKICNHTNLLMGSGDEDGSDGDDEEEGLDEAARDALYEQRLIQGSGKLQTLDRMLPILQADGHRVLIFSQFTSMLDILEDYCERRSYSYVRLDGETNRVKRRLDCRRFNAPNSNLFIFLISTRAGGLGLNLATADTVILYDSDWNPQVDLQAMERAHRIGQTKPVRVYRLICSGSVEERMIYRAEKKLFLNAMVAETVKEEGDGSEEGAVEAEENEAALSIGGTNMSKGELASLIRFGANCVFDNKSGGGGGESIGSGEISDAELADLLERQGRDKLPAQKDVVATLSTAATTADSQSCSSADGVGGSIFDRQSATIKDRMESMEEVDIRQLGSVLYKKKQIKVPANTIMPMDAATLALQSTKRVSKQRVVMVDGRGTGYGGAVPVLAETMDRVALEDEAPAVSAHRGRQWTHQCFCTLCGRVDYLPPVIVPPPPTSKRAKPKKIVQPKLVESPLVRCAHCPWAFHGECMQEYGMSSMGRNNSTSIGGGGTSSGMFICPHHKCVSCYRATAAAGGLLFRCTGCLTSYCEDCLPEEEIESIGRFRALENATEYLSRQSYYIKCPSCCYVDNRANPSGKRNKGITASNSSSNGNDNGSSALKQSMSMASIAASEPNGTADDEDEESDMLLQSAAADAETAPEEEEEEDVAVVPTKTQLMRIHLTEILPPPPPTPPPLTKKQKTAAKKAAAALSSPAGKRKNGKASVASPAATGSSRKRVLSANDSIPDFKSGSRNRSKKVRAAEQEESSDEEEEEEEEEVDPCVSVPLTKSAYSLAEAMEVVCAVPLIKQWMLGLPASDIVIPAAAGASSSSGGRVSGKSRSTETATTTKDKDSAACAINKDTDAALLNIYSKIERGRYRSAANFTADVKHVLENILLKRANSGSSSNGKNAITPAERTVNLQLSNEAMDFFRTQLEPLVDVTL